LFGLRVEFPHGAFVKEGRRGFVRSLRDSRRTRFDSAAEINLIKMVQMILPGPVAANPALVTVHLLAATTWVGGFVAIAVVGRVARRTLEPPARIAFFRGLGRAYGVVGGASLLVALGTGFALLPDRSSGTGIAAIALAAALLAATAAGVRQARRMTRLRRHALEHRDEPGVAERLRRASRSAAVLRSAIGLLTLALVLLAAILAA
jgi:uncharacterized membrane protein